MYLKVISEWPVAEHLKEGMMVHVLSNIVKVVVLSTYSHNICYKKIKQSYLHEYISGY